MNACRDVVAPAAFSMPSVECIMTTRMMHMPLATSTQSSRFEPSCFAMPVLPAGRSRPCPALIRSGLRSKSRSNASATRYHDA